MIALRAAARALNGEVCGQSIRCPGPGHSHKDRSLAVSFSAMAPLGFICFSHSGDDWKHCQAYVADKLGIATDAWKRKDTPRRAIEALQPPVESEAEDDDRAAKIAGAVALWRAAIDPRGTLVETYLRTRGLELGDDIAGSVLRWAPDIDAMVALFRSIETNRPQAISRTFLDRDGAKIKRMFSGPVGGAAIMLDGFDTVTHGLFVGEGIETCLSALALGLRPCWALGSAGSIASFPMIGGVEALNVIVDHDPNGVGEKAARAVEARWLAAGREVNLLRSDAPGDLNDMLKGAA
jgi:putative DNA primase/helicase